MVIGKVLRKRFQLSSLSPEEKQRLGSYIKQLGGTYLDKQVCHKDLKVEVLKFKVNRQTRSLSDLAVVCRTVLIVTLALPSG